MKHVAIDYETFPIGPGQVIPAPVCLSLASRADLGPYLPDSSSVVTETRRGVQVALVGDDEEGAMADTFHRLLTDPDVHIVCHFAAFDACVGMFDDPERAITSVFSAADAQRIHDVLIIEKLLNLSTIGSLESRPLPNSEKGAEIKYDLASLESFYLGFDRRDEKESEEGDHWRVNYSVLSGTAPVDYPREAADYAIADAWGTLLVFEEQMKRAKPEGHESCSTEAFQAAVSICLQLMTNRGMLKDREQVERLHAALTEKLSPEQHRPLYEAGFLTPPQPERMRKTKAGQVMRHRKGPLEGQPIVVKAQPEKSSHKAIRSYIEEFCESRGLEPKRSETGLVSMDKDALQQIAPLDESGLLERLHTRAKYIKLRDAFLPVLLEEHDRVYPGFNVLVSTGRTSSRNAGGKKKLFPSMNIQQAPRIEEGNLAIRACFVPDPGHVFCAIDFSALELCSFAQQTYDLFGFSVHRDKINLGYDLHAYLGSQLAYSLDAGIRESLDGASDDEIYREFLTLKGCGIAEFEKKFKHYRTFAKPTGLGFPGGLGPRTFIDYARQTYGVEVDLDTATKLKALWLRTYPEADRYLNEWVPHQEDHENAGDERGGLCYTSPLGMFRANSNYCATANGYGLQTPSAEGAKLAVWSVTRRCVDPISAEDPLYGGMPIAFVHDELIFMFPEERAFAMGARASQLMCEAMAIIMPDVRLSAQPAYMRRWLKGAEPETIDGTPVLYDLVDGRIVMEKGGSYVDKSNLDKVAA